MRHCASMINICFVVKSPLISRIMLPVCTSVAGPCRPLNALAVATTLQRRHADEDLYLDIAYLLSPVA